MPNSLKCRLKKLAYQGLLSEKDLSRLYTDNDVIEELEKIKAEIETKCKVCCLPRIIAECNISKSNREWCEYYYCLKIINEHISELKGENK